MASRISARFNAWSTAVVAGGLAVARLAHVVRHWEYFERDPLRAFAVWNVVSLDVPTAALLPAAVTLATLSSEPLDLAQPAGRPTVINLWATWYALPARDAGPGRD